MAKKVITKTDEERGRVNVSVSRATYKKLQEFAQQQPYAVRLSKIVETAVLEHMGKGGAR